MKNTNLILFVLALFFSLVAVAEVFILPDETGIHKWIDDEGKAHFSKSDFAKSKRKTSKPELGKNSADTEENFLTAKPVKPKVEVYYASWDPLSEKAIEFFRNNHIVVNAYDIEVDADAAKRKKELDPAFIGIPLVVINGVIIRGVNEDQYNEALTKRYDLPEKQ